MLRSKVSSKSFAVFLITLLFAYLPANVMADDYIFSETAIGKDANNGDAIDAFMFAMVRSAEKNRTAAPCRGHRGVLYYKKTKAVGASEPIVDTLKACIAPEGTNWTTCNPTTVYSRTRVPGETDIVAADFVVGATTSAVVWAELMIGAPSKVSYFVSFTTDMGNNWAAPILIGEYEGPDNSSYAFAPDIDGAINDAGHFAFAMFFNQSTGFNHKILDNASLVVIDHWIGVALFQYSITNPSAPTRIVEASDRLDFANIKPSSFIDIVSGPDRFFHVLYGKNGMYEIFTQVQPGVNFTREIPGANRPAGFGPSASRTKSGIAVLTNSGRVFNVPHPNLPITERSGNLLGRYVVGNKFSDYLATDSLIPHSMRDVTVAHHRGDGSGHSVIHAINNPSSIFRCVDMLTYVGDECYVWKRTEQESELSSTVTSGEAALNGNDFMVATLYTKREWDTDRYYDVEQKIAVSDYRLPFEEACHTGGGGGCFLAGTPILLSNGQQIPIEAVTPGMSVKAYDESISRITSGTVKEIMRHNVDGYLIINGKIKVTPNHPFWAIKRPPFQTISLSPNLTSNIEINQGSWYEIGELEVGDMLFTENGRAVLINSIENRSGNIEVFNFEVEKYHTYIADNLVVHNKKLAVAIREIDGVR